MTPVLINAVSKLDGNARILKVDIDKSPVAARRFGVCTVPALILFRM